MTILYENTDIIVKGDDNKTYVGYKGDKMYEVQDDLHVLEFLDSKSKWSLTYKKGANVITRFGFVLGDNSGIWIKDHWYWRIGDGRLMFEEVGEDEDILCEARLELVDNKGECIRGYFIGYVDEAEVAS